MPTTKKSTKKKATKARPTQARPRKAAAADDVPASERIDGYLAERDDWRGALLARIRALFHATDPEVVEEWKWMGSPVYSHQGILAVTNAHKDKVKLTFNDGAQLPDPHGLFNAGLGGGKWRAIDLYEGDALDEKAFAELIRAAVAFNLSRKKK